eukprot:570182-Alexandrium_andersonii.AAC.1
MVIQQWWLDVLRTHFPKRPRQKKLRKDFLPRGTRGLIQARKKHLTCIHRVSRMRQALELVACFKVWAHLHTRDRTSWHGQRVEGMVKWSSRVAHG